MHPLHPARRPGSTTRSSIPAPTLPTSFLRLPATPPSSGAAPTSSSTAAVRPARAPGPSTSPRAATSAEGSPYPSPLSTDDLRAPIASCFPSVNPHNSIASVASDANSDTDDSYEREDRDWKGLRWIMAVERSHLRGGE
ncbi:hypothetical protein FKP32DRAFT_1681077 [Trametes sanguinea]|nr:hypothetical protein FKP32DRAFT_1681077 [Trametes sanguinea]